MTRVAYLCTDLLFTSKIRETASQLGAEARPARDPAALVAATRGADLAIVDLRRPDALDALAQLAAEPATARVPKVGFCDHELADLMERARAAGCGRVLAKGKFSTELPTLIGLLDAPGPGWPSD
jgi:hypothetical protein